MQRGLWRREWRCAVLLVVTFGVGAPSPSVASDGRDLIDAVKRVDLEAIDSLLSEGIDVDARTIDGATALHWAVHLDDVAMVERLIAAGADVNAENHYEVQPLFLAAENGTAEITERLLVAGADPNAAMPGHETALMTASRTGRPDVVRLLLDYGADATAQESTRGQDALMWAAARGNAEVIRLLVAAGADVHARSEDPTPKRSGSGTRPDRGDTAFTGNMRFTPLLFAVRAGQIDAVRALIDAGADLNDASEPDGYSALVIAAINAHWELGAELLENGADPDANEQGWTALHQVVRTRTLDVNGQTPHPEPTGKLTSMDFALKLLDHGADINARMTKDSMDGYGESFRRTGATPYLCAAKGPDAEMMRFLLAHGADPTIRTAINSTALMTAAGVNIQYLDEDSGTPEAALEVVKVSLAYDDVNAVNDNGDTALHGAAFRGDPTIIQLLVDEGADLSAKNLHGLTPLMVANAYISIIVTHRAEATALLRSIMEERGMPVELLTAVETTGRMRRQRLAAENAALLEAIDEVLDNKDVQVVTDYTTVTLRGRVRTAAERELVLEMTRNTPGIEHIMDEIEVVNP